MAFAPLRSRPALAIGWKEQHDNTNVGDLPGRGHAGAFHAVWRRSAAIARWQVLWQEHFPQTRFWKVEQARLPHPNQATLLPRALVVAFFTSPDAPRDDWERLLRFLAPITTAGGRGALLLQ
jgi:hypothetical protein